MNDNTAKAEADIRLIIRIIDRLILEDKSFLNINKKYDSVFDKANRDYWEFHISKIFTKDSTIATPLSICKALQDADDKTMERTTTFIKFILTLTVRIFLAVGDIKSINKLIYLACDNIDTWLIRNKMLRPFPFINPVDTKRSEAWTEEHFLLYAESEDNNIKIGYNDFDKMVELTLKVYSNPDIDEASNEFKIVKNIVTDFITIIFSKARMSSDTVEACIYCESLFYYTEEEQKSNQFLAISGFECLCSECLIEKKKDEYKVENRYLITIDKKSRAKALKYLIFSKEK